MDGSSNVPSLLQKCLGYDGSVCYNENIFLNVNKHEWNGTCHMNKNNGISSSQKSALTIRFLDTNLMVL